MTDPSANVNKPCITWELNESESDRLRLLLSQARNQMLLWRVGLPVGIGVLIAIAGTLHQYRIGVEWAYALNFGLRILAVTLGSGAIVLACWWLISWRVRRLNRRPQLSIRFDRHYIMVGAKAVNLLFWAHHRRFEVLERDGHPILRIDLEHKQTFGPGRAKIRLMIPIPAGNENDVDRLRACFGR